MQKALVTGGSGFVAGHLVQQLLTDGYEVNATVRDPDDPRKTAALRLMQDAYPGRLEIFAADLLHEHCFDPAMEGVDTVFHVASPFYMAEQITDPQTELVEPALLGTQNVLASVDRTESVRRVVLTSTIGAMFGHYVDVPRRGASVLTEDMFNETSSLEHSPYHYSKVLAEREAWRIAGAQERWNMVAINPGLVLGPALTDASVSGSLFLLDELMSGKLWFGVPDIAFAPVDVRDVALAHVRAGERDQAHGRYIVSHPEMVSMRDMARELKKVHQRPVLVPRNEIPKWTLKLLGGFFGLDRQFVDDHVGVRFSLDNRRSIDELDIEYRPVAESLRDHYEAWQRGR